MKGCIMSKSVKSEDGFRDKIKSFLGIGSSRTSQVTPGGSRTQQREFVFTHDLLKDISASSPANHRLKTIRDMQDVVLHRTLEDNAVEVLWVAISDLVTPTSASDERQVALRFLQALIAGQYEKLGMMRVKFFRVLRCAALWDAGPLRLHMFSTLTRDGKDLLYFEDETGEFLVSWMKDLAVSPCANFLRLLINVVKFNAAYLDEDVMVGLVLRTCAIAARTTCEEDIGVCLQVLDTVICYAYLPAASLHHFILCLCRVVNIEKFCQNTWMLMRKLLGTHLGHGGVYRMCVILQNKSNAATHDGAILLRGAVFFIGMALWGSKRVTSLRHPATTVLPSFLAALRHSRAPIVAYEVVLSVQRLVNKYGRDQDDVTWSVILDIIQELLHYQTDTSRVSPLLAANIQELLTCIEAFCDTPGFAGSPDRFYSLIEMCAASRPDCSLHALIMYKSKMIHPSREGWVQSLSSLVDTYFRREKRSAVRIKVLEVLSDVLHSHRLLHEEVLLEQVVVPHLCHLDAEKDGEVCGRAVRLLVELAATCSSHHGLELIALINKVLQSVVSPPSSPSPAAMDGVVTRLSTPPKLDHVMVAVNGLIRLFRSKLCVCPAAHACRVYQLLVEHLEAHYHQDVTHAMAPLRHAGIIREEIFRLLLEMRADSLLRVVLPAEGKEGVLCCSPYVTYSLNAGDGSERHPSSDRASPSPKCASISWGLAWRCVRLAVEVEVDWRVLELILGQLPDLLRDRGLVLTAHHDDIIRFTARLCELVSSRSLSLGLRYQHTPANFQKSHLHVHIFPVLAALVAYHAVLDKPRQELVVRCVEFGLVSRTARVCVQALTVCALDMADVMRRQLPAVLLRLSQISANTAMAVPLMDFLSSLTRLPDLYASFVEEQYMSVFAIALPYTNPFKYNHYTVSLAYHVIAMWFLKCKLCFRKRFVTFIVKGLRANVLRQFEETSVQRSRQNQDSADRLRAQSLNDDVLKSAPPVDSGKAAAAAARVKTGSGASPAPPCSPPPSPEDSSSMLFHTELMETCIDALARYTFSTCASVPRRTPVAEFLLAGGQSCSWMIGNKIVTITTSGGARVGPSRLCDRCLAMARPPLQPADGIVASVSDESMASGGRKRHKSAAVRSFTETVPLKPASQDDMNIGKSSPSSTSTLSDTTLARPPNDLAITAKGGDMREAPREERMYLVDSVLMGLTANPTDSSIFSSSSLCACWCTQWAEIHIRRATGSLSWAMRIQNTQDLAEAFPDFPLDDLSNLFMSAPEEETMSTCKDTQIESGSVADRDYDSLLEETFYAAAAAAADIPCEAEETADGMAPLFPKSCASPDLAPVLEELSYASTDTPSTGSSKKDLSEVASPQREVHKNRKEACNTRPEEITFKGKFEDAKRDFENLSAAGALSVDVEEAAEATEASERQSSRSQSLSPGSSSVRRSSTGCLTIPEKSALPAPSPLVSAGCTTGFPSAIPSGLSPGVSPIASPSRLGSPRTVERRISAPASPRSQPLSGPPAEDEVRERSHTVAVSSPRMRNLSSRTTSSEASRPSSLEADLSSTTGSTGAHGGVSPAFLFLQLYHSPLVAGAARPLELPKLAMVERAVKMLDIKQPYETHKLGVVYVGPGQEACEAAILANCHGSARYVHFLQGLGRLLQLSECNQDDTYLGGLDVEGNDGLYAYAWHDDFMQVIYHVVTLMPRKESDPHCNNKKLHIGNDYVNIVYNDSGQLYNIATIKCQFNYVNILVTPLAHNSSQVDVVTRKDLASSSTPGRSSLHVELDDMIGHSETKVVSDANLAALVRQIAVNANLASVVFQRQKTAPQDPYASNWLERLRQIKRIRQKVEQEKARADKGRAGSPVAEDFTDFV